MDYIKKLITFFKKIMDVKEKIITIESNQTNITENRNDNFKETLKYNVTEKIKKKKIEIPICEGDGLGIRKNISY